MSESLLLKKSVEALIDRAEQQCSFNIANFPQEIIDELIIRPTWAIDLIEYLKYYHGSADSIRTKILFILISESLSQIRYSLDRKDRQGQVLLRRAQEAINDVINGLAQNLQIALTQVIFDSKLNIEVQEEQEVARKNDIAPALPELLGRLRREQRFKNAFELYNLILPHIQLLPVIKQLAIIAEMAYAKKAIIHEVTLLMLLHPKRAVRQQVADLLYNLSDRAVFTAVDLRRLIVIRNWVSLEERGDIDKLMTHLKQKKLSPAPYPIAKICRLMGSSMDGAGAACILIESKIKNQRQAAGFIIKIGVGIRDPWVSNKTPRHYFDKMISEQQKRDNPHKSVSTTYVNKMVQHFLSESLKSKEIPEPGFLQIAEIFGADNWLPQPLSWPDEISRLREKYADNLTEAFIKASLQRSSHWHQDQMIARYWFETGEIAEQAVVTAIKEHDKNPTSTFVSIVAECVIAQCLEKWKTVFLIACLWMRTKKTDEHCADLFTVLHCLDTEVPPSSIPLISNVASLSAASAFRRV